MCDVLSSEQHIAVTQHVHLAWAVSALLSCSEVCLQKINSLSVRLIGGCHLRIQCWVPGTLSPCSSGMLAVRSNSKQIDGKLAAGGGRAEGALGADADEEGGADGEAEGVPAQQAHGREEGAGALCAACSCLDLC